MRDFGFLIMRLTVGGLLVGHGAQKLFGWFGGYGLQGTGGWMESIGLRPGRWWALLAGLGEFGGGLLTALGLFHPVGPIMTVGPMVVAASTVHAGKPIWAASGGGELPVTYMAVGLGLSLTGPGRYSLDRALGIKVPSYLIASSAVGVALGIGLALASRKVEVPARQAESIPAEESTESAREELQGGQQEVA